jgi:hypothetical protein
MIISYELIRLLESENYRVAPAYIADVDPSRSSLYLESYYKPEPFLFKVYFIDLIGPSLESLLEILTSHLEKTQALIEKFKYIDKPLSYYSAFEEEVKDFINKGKNLFLKTEDLIYTTEVKEKRVVKKQDIKGSLTEETLMERFQLEYDQDKNKKIVEEDAGFRSLPEIHKKYGKKLELSWKTFHDKAKLILSRSPRFESRKRMKTGGGTEYRVKPTEFIETKKERIIMPLENLKNESYEILMDYEQAKILHDDGKASNAVDIFERIIQSYEDTLETYSFVFCDTCYRLGFIYEIYGYLEDAVRVYEAGQQNQKFSDKKSYLFEIALIKIEILQGNHKNLMTILSEIEKEIRKILKGDFAELNSIFIYIEDTKIEDLDLVYIRDLKRDPEYSKNPIFKEIIQLDLDLLNLQILKLDLIRRSYYIESFKSVEIDTLNNEIYFNQSVSQKMKELLEQANEILNETKKNKFNWANRDFILLRLFESFFTGKGSPDTRDFDYGIPDTFFPFYYTKFLFNMAYYLSFGERIIFERLDKFEFTSLDPASQVEYLLKFCTSKWRDYQFGTRGNATINIYKNMKTLMDHASFLVEKYDLREMHNTVIYVQSWMSKMVEDFIVGYFKATERLKKRLARKS